MDKGRNVHETIYGGLLEDHVMNGNLEGVRIQLEGGVSPDWSSGRFGSVVAMAVTCEQPEALRMLLDAGARVEAIGTDGIGALALAAGLGNMECARLLVERGASVDGIDPDQESYDRADMNLVDYPQMNIVEYPPLVVAVWNGREKMVAWLLSLGAHKEVEDHNGKKPLMWAAKSGEAECAQVLISHGANVEAQDAPNGATVAMYALWSGDENTMLAVCEAGFDENKSTWLGERIADYVSLDPTTPSAMAYKAWLLAKSEKIELGEVVVMDPEVSAKPKLRM